MSLSSDGLTVAVGGVNDNGGVGAIWLFQNDGSGGYTQLGPKLVGSGSIGAAQQGKD